jgi:hypothetical protein
MDPMTDRVTDPMTDRVMDPMTENRNSLGLYCERARGLSRRA